MAIAEVNVLSGNGNIAASPLPGDAIKLIRAHHWEDPSFSIGKACGESEYSSLEAI